MKAKIMPISLYEQEIEQFDAAVARRKAVAVNPATYTRSTLIREWLHREALELQLQNKGQVPPP